MIPPNQGSSLFQDSSLNRTPRENFYISIYEDLNEFFKDFLDMGWNLIYVVKVSDPDDETRIGGSPYKFDMRNNPKISHLGKTLIITNW